MSEPQKDREGKVEPTLVDSEFIRAIARVRMYGNQKYPDKDNWKGNPMQFYKDAAYRHWLQYLDGEYYDKESGLPHLTHLACNIMFIYWMEENKQQHRTIIADQVSGPQGQVDMFGNSLPLVIKHPTLGRIRLLDFTEDDLYHLQENNTDPTRKGYEELINLTKKIQEQELTID